LAREKRTKIQLYFDIISAIIQEEDISPTRIQFKCNTSYDKLMKYLGEMEEREIISKNGSIDVTDKGKKFHSDYSKINDLISEISKSITVE
jgi:predicted transcriptional regulator|tara:strand:- start:868 stop:1140 length:273 start_codon:yes stop_codon:yes gene_type:complete